MNPYLANRNNIKIQLSYSRRRWHNRLYVQYKWLHINLNWKQRKWLNFLGLFTVRQDDVEQVIYLWAIKNIYECLSAVCSKQETINPPMYLSIPPLAHHPSLFLPPSFSSRHHLSFCSGPHVTWLSVPRPQSFDVDLELISPDWIMVKGGERGRRCRVVCRAYFIKLFSWHSNFEERVHHDHSSRR